MSISRRSTVADLLALKGRRPLTMLYVDTLDEAAGAIGAELEVVPERVATEISRRTPHAVDGLGPGL
jgi:ketopantoate hydroxymethyltransferase